MLKHVYKCKKPKLIEVSSLHALCKSLEAPCTLVGLNSQCFHLAYWIMSFVCWSHQLMFLSPLLQKSFCEDLTEGKFPIIHGIQESRSLFLSAQEYPLFFLSLSFTLFTLPLRGGSWVEECVVGGVAGREYGEDWSEGWDSCLCTCSCE